MWELRPSSKPSNGTRGNRDEVIATIATDKASKEPSERDVLAEDARREEPSLPQTREQTLAIEEATVDDTVVVTNVGEATVDDTEVVTEDARVSEMPIENTA